MHCHKHSVYHATCPDCKRKIRKSESSLTTSSDSLLTDMAMTTAVESIIDSSSTDTIADSTGFSSDSSGGDFGGGGAGGDY